MANCSDGHADDLVEQSPNRPVKQSGPSLLPAFDDPSSPLARDIMQSRPQNLKASLKRSFDTMQSPPTSSTAIMPSSSPTQRPRRPGLQRTTSVMSQRSALMSLPSIEVPSDGRTIRLGRSSKACDYQFPFSSSISRIHVEATYQPHENNQFAEIIITCLGWNGCKVHFQGSIYKLAKGQTFRTHCRGEEIMLDVQAARVLVEWPTVLGHSDGEEEEPLSNTPLRRFLSSTPTPAAFASSPPRLVPLSPSPDDVFGGPGNIDIYEDDPADEANDAETQKEQDRIIESPKIVERPNGHNRDMLIQSNSTASLSKSTANFMHHSEHDSDDEDEENTFHDHNEENDPIVASFGPFGENLLPRLASFNTQATPHDNSKSPVPRQPALVSNKLYDPFIVQPKDIPEGVSASPFKKPDAPRLHSQDPDSSTADSSSELTMPSPKRPRFNISPIKNHVVNQLAFSRIHAVPAFTILEKLPIELKTSMVVQNNPNEPTMMNVDRLKSIMHEIPCVGEIARAGKDAAGKPLENEYYYIPEMDGDETRRQTVMGGMRGTGLRTVRKAHKVSLHYTREIVF
jgi:hypothetical protein